MECLCIVGQFGLKARLGFRGFQRPLHRNAAHDEVRREGLTAEGHTIISMDTKSFYMGPLALHRGIPARSQEDFLTYSRRRKSHHQICYSKFVSRESRMEASLDELWIMNVQRGKIIKVIMTLRSEPTRRFHMPPYQSTAQPHDYMVRVVHIACKLFNVIKWRTKSDDLC